MIGNIHTTRKKNAMPKKEPKVRICAKCGAQISAATVIDGKRHSLAARKYCLGCSPFNAHNTRQLEKIEPARAFGKKTCSVCRIVQPVAEFYRRSYGPSPYCKKCTNLKTKQRMVATTAKGVTYKGGKCQKCGYAAAIEVLEFHHRDTKAKNFTIAANRTRSWGQVKGELDKCDLLCANCHREEHERLHIKHIAISYSGLDAKKCSKCTIAQHFSEFYMLKTSKLYSHCKTCTKNDCNRRHRRAKQECVDYKGGGCLICGYMKCLGAMEFHHRDPKEKDMGIGSLYVVTPQIKEELDKCDMLCANCHREEHARLNKEAQPSVPL